MIRLVPPMTLKEFEEVAKTKAHPTAWRYVSYNAGGLTGTMTRNYLDRLRLRTRVLRDVSNVDTSVTLCDGTTLSVPLIIAPTAFHKMFHPDGELATVRAAAKAGVMYCYNVFLASVTINKIVADPLARSGPKWLHVYFLKGRRCVQKLVERAEATGMFTAIIVTCDHPHNRVRDYIRPDFMNYFKDFNLDGGLTPNAVDDDGQPFSEEETAMDASLTWKDLDWLKSITKLPIIAKGILDEEDAVTAVKHGASAIVVSNHGGRQIDSAVSSIEALPHIVSALKKANLNVDVYVDSGIRSGVDMIKALSLGAKAVLLGRPVLWGLAYNGQEGLEWLLSCLKEEFVADLMSLGYPKLSALGPHVFWEPSTSAL